MVKAQDTWYTLTWTCIVYYCISMPFIIIKALAFVYYFGICSNGGDFLKKVIFEFWYRFPLIYEMKILIKMLSIGFDVDGSTEMMWR